MIVADVTASGRLLGCLDEINGRVIEGWAIDPENEEEAESLDVLIDGVVVAETKAALFREDLAKAGIRSGYARFSYTIPARYGDGRPHTLDLRHGGSPISIVNAPTSFTISSPGEMDVRTRGRWALDRFVLRDETTGPEFAAAVRAARRVAIVSTFHNARDFMVYHRQIVHGLVASGFVVLVVHASSLEADQVNLDFGPGCFAIVKRNVGYDFGSWAVGVFALTRVKAGLRELVLVNDSIIALAGGVLSALIARCRQARADVVGVTESYERQYHLQSYFLWFGERVVAAAALPAFMARYSFSSDKGTVIEEGELALTARLVAEGYRIACLTPYEAIAQRWLSNVDAVVAEIRNLPRLQVQGTDAYKSRSLEQLDTIVAMVLSGHPLNPGHFFWDTLIEHCDCKLLKRELVMLNPCHVPTHYRLGKLLAALPEARHALLDIRRHYGGQLIPAFWEPTPDEPRTVDRRVGGERDAGVPAVDRRKPRPRRAAHPAPSLDAARADDTS